MLFVAFYGLTEKGVPAQEIQEPARLQGIYPQIHLDLDPDIRITANLQDSPSITECSDIPLQDTPFHGETDSPEKVSTIEEEKVKPDWSGLTRDSLYFVGYQLVVIGLLYFMPESVSNWSDEQKESYSLDKWTENVKETGFDDDDWYLNYIVHPYWGATYYIRARERGFNKFHSFLYSAFLSSLYEFGPEALFEPPSIQDLIVTPCAGSLLGMYFEEVRKGIKAKGTQRKWYDSLALILTDPLGTLSKYTDRLLGIQSTVELKSFRSPLHQYKETNLNYMKSEKFVMTDINFKPSIGLQVRLAW
jgi:hypothetical protein